MKILIMNFERQTWVLMRKERSKLLFTITYDPWKSSNVTVHISFTQHNSADKFRKSNILHEYFSEEGPI